MGAAASTAIATVIATVITSAVFLATQRSANKAAERNTNVTSRADIERDAFDRAKTFYTDTIDRQAKRIADLESDLGEERRSRAADVLMLRERLAEDEREMGRLRNDLEAAKRAIRSLRRPATD